MAKADLRVLKPEYLRLIDLLRHHRELELGKTGLTHIPMTEVSTAVSEQYLGQYLDTLLNDDVLRLINKNSRETPYVVDGKGSKRELVVYCEKTTEEMLAYRKSLIIQGALGIQVDAHAVNGVPAYYEAYQNGYPENSVRLSDREGALLDFLINNPNTPRSRAEVADACELTPTQVSNTLNAIRRKLVQLGFTEDKVEEMLPRYARDGLMFNNRA